MMPAPADAGVGQTTPRRRGRTALLLLALTFAATQSHAAEQVVPPGNDALIAVLLGTGRALPGDCKFAGGSVERTFVSARYDCRDAPSVQIELRHPTDAPADATRTQQFAIVARGAAPPALLEAIAHTVREGESHFHWLAPPTPVAASEPSAAPTPARSLVAYGGAGGALAMFFLAAVLAAPLAVIIGVIGSYLAALLAPPQRGEPVWTADRRRQLGYLAVFLAVFTYVLAAVAPNWGMQIDEERDFILSALCASGKGCPLVGNEMNQLRIKLGPLNRYLMTLGQLVTPDPRFALIAILALHALAAAWLARAGDRLLGAPYGLFAGLVFGANPLMLHVIGAASNGAWSSLFIVGAIVGTLDWLRGEARGLILAVTCLAAAAQLHGTNLALVPPLLFAAFWWRPPMPRWALLGCAAIVLALYSPWLVYQWSTRGSDFTMMSTAWMVAYGPDVIGRLLRLVQPLGDLFAPLAVIGIAALANGTGLAPPERAGRRAVLLFLAPPLAATLLAGGGWTPRYAVPMIVPAALAAAAGTQTVVSRLLRRRNRRAGLAFGAVALAAMVGPTLIGILVRSSAGEVAARQVRLDLAEQIEAIRILGEHGFSAADLETRVHGAAWDRWDGGHIYLGHWLIGGERRAADGEHVAIVECESAGATASEWEQQLTSSRALPHRLVGYRAALTPPTVEFLDRDGVSWTSERAVPFYGQMSHGGDAQLRTVLDPRLAYPSEFADLTARLRSRPPTQMRLRATLAAGPDDRVLALVYDEGLSATVAVGGVPRQPIAPSAPVGNSRRERYLLSAAERRDDLTVEALIDLPPPAAEPRQVDLFEEPACAPSR